MKKRILKRSVVAVLLALSFVLTGCGKKEDSQEEIEDPVINSMTVEDICEYLTDTVNLRSHQSYFCNAGNSDDLDWYEDDGVIDRGRIVVYDSEDPDNYDSPLTYYINFTVSEFDPDVVSELNVGDYSAGGTIVAISGNFTLIAFEVTDYELYQMYEEDINSVSIYDCTNHSAPYSYPELQAVYELFVELGEASSLDDIDVESIVSEIPEETTPAETVPLATTDESLVINSMTIEELCEYLSPYIDPNDEYGVVSEDGLASYTFTNDNPGVLELWENRAYGIDLDYSDEHNHQTTYYARFTIIHMDPSYITDLSVGDEIVIAGSYKWTVSAISGDYILCAEEVTDYALYNEAMAGDDYELFFECFNQMAPYAEPNIQNLYNAFVALGTATSLDDISIDETTDGAPAGGSSEVPDSEADSDVCWYDNGYVSSPYTYTNTTAIRLDYLNEYYLSYQSGTIFYDVVYNGQTVYMSGLGEYVAEFDTSYSGATTSGQYLAAGTYTITFYDADMSDSPIGDSSCTVVVE